MRYFFLLLCAFLFAIAGCKKDKGIPVVNGYGVGRVEAYTDIALNAKPTPPVVVECLNGIKAEVPILKAERNGSAAVIADQQVEAAKRNVKIGEQATTIAAYKNRWIGDKTFQWGRWIVGGWIAAYIVGLALNTLSGGFGLLIGRFVLNIIPSPLFFLRVK